MQVNTEAPPPGSNAHSRLFQLDGWRGISILCVLAAHLLPLGPNEWRLNATAGVMGMSLFFSLSGYLITSFLLDRPNPVPFLIRRVCRILPLAWLFMLITLAVYMRPREEWFANFFFYLNYTTYAQPFNSHLWSLCVEMHFYVSVALLVAICGRKGVYLLPIACVVITGMRIATGNYASVNTHHRADEILVGATLAIVAHDFRLSTPTWVNYLNPSVAVILLCIASSPFSGPVQYLRPYAGGLAIASTLLAPDHWLSKGLKSKFLVYCATISYALYVIHGPFRGGWFSGENSFDRYVIKRPLGIFLTFLLAHLSTFYFESYWIGVGKRLTSKTRKGQQGQPPFAQPE